MIQDKFLDSFISDIYAIGEEKNNVFWFRGNKDETNYIKTVKPIEYIGHDIIIIKNKLQSLKANDNIFVHWYDNWIADLVFNLPNKLYVFFWGGELYEEPFWHHAKWIYDKITYKIIKKQLYPKIVIRKNIFRLMCNILDVLQFSNIVKTEYEKKLKLVERIDYIIFNQLNIAEIEKIKELYQSFKAIHLAGQYDLNFDLAIQISKQQKKTGTVKILVGNSATPSNNHLDAFEKLKKLKNIEVFCSLSYGAEWYKKIVVKEGVAMFGDRFHPITDFMKRKDYVEFISEMDIIYMNHNRSQAWGNIATSLTLGKPVFLKDGNALKQFIFSIGIETYDVDLIGKCDLESIIINEKQNRVATVEKLKTSISDEIRLKNLKEIMSLYAN
jgi:hypothetical protein